MNDEAIYVVFDGSPAPDGPFVEVENAKGESVGLGRWAKRDDGLWALRIPTKAETDALLASRLARLVERIVAEGYVRRNRAKELLERVRNMERGPGFLTDAELAAEAEEEKKELLG